MYISDFLNYLDKNALQQQFGYRNPVTGVISEALGIPAAARVANKLSYGEPITNVGKANVPLIPEDTAEAAMFAAPIAGAYGKTAGKMAGRAINDAMVYGEGALAKVTPQPMKIFVGPNSATFDKIDAVRAQAMERAGHDAEKIWQETGTFRGPDNQWRQEISDENLKVNDYRNTGGGISINHPELQAAYEQIPRGVKVVPTPEYQQMASYEAPKRDLDWKLGEGGTIRVPTNEPTPIDVYAHELQHAVQSKEGFASGGNPKNLTPEIAQARYDLKEIERQMSNLHDKASDEARYYIAKAKKDPQYKNFVDEAFAKYTNQLGEKSDKNPFGVDLNDAVKFHLIEQDGLVNKLGEKADSLRKLANLDPQEAYFRLAGEAEARAVQERLNMTPAERRAKFPLKSYDVPLRDLILRYK